MPDQNDRRRNTESDEDAGNAKKDQNDNSPGQGQRLSIVPFALVGVVAIVFATVILFVIFRPHPDAWTDDAYVRAHYAVISPRVSGQVSTVLVDDNQMVRAGDLLVTLDPRDYRNSVANAEAAVERDEGQVSSASADVTRQPSLIEEQEASVTSARAALVLSEANAKRYKDLASAGAGSTQQRQQADTTLRQNQASLQAEEASLDAARKQLAVLKSQVSSDQGTAKSDRAQLDQANLNLSYTGIRAPVDGMVGQRNVEPGDSVSASTTLMVVVPLSQIYVEANYREVQLRHIRRGQHATIHVDAYDLDLDGVVDSVPPASGASFSPIAPDNATGNFTKIVQRLPVKIALIAGQPLSRLLRVGFSVEATVHTGLENVVDEQAHSAGFVTAR